MKVSLRTAAIACLAVLLLCVAVAVATVLARGDHRRSGSKGRIDPTPALRVELRAFLQSTPPFSSMTWSTELKGRPNGTVAILVARSDAASGLGDGLNAAYDRRADVVLMSRALFDMATRSPAFSTERHFATLLLLHELGHRESARSAQGPAKDAAEEERRADNYAVDRYVGQKRAELSALVDELWNVAEGGLLTRLTQYDWFDPLRPYAPHGSFIQRISNIYKAVLRHPNLSGEDAAFVRGLVEEVDRFLANSASFDAVLTLPVGVMPTGGAVCPNGAVILGSDGLLYRLVAQPGTSRVEGRHLYGIQGPITWRSTGADQAAIVRFECDSSNRLVALDESGRLWIAQSSIGSEPRSIDAPSLQEVLDLLAGPRGLRFLKAQEDGFAWAATDDAKGIANMPWHRIPQQTCPDGDCTGADPLLTSDAIVLQRRSDSGDELRLQWHPSDASQPLLLQGRTVVGRAVGGHGVLLAAKSNEALDISSLDHGQPMRAIASVPLSPARARRSSMIPKLTAAQAGCLAIAAPGAIFALVRDGKIALKDEYLSATDIVLPLEPGLFLVNIPYSRFLPIVRC